MKAIRKFLNHRAVVMVGLAIICMSFIACSPEDKRGFRSKRPIVDPATTVDPSAKTDDADKNKDSVNEVTPPSVPAGEVGPEFAGTNNELLGAQPADVAATEEGAEETTESAEGEEAQGEATTPEMSLSDEDSAFALEASELFSVEILGQELTAEEMQAQLKKLDPEMSKSIIAFSVDKTVNTAQSESTPGIYRLDFNMALRWKDATGQQHSSHLVASREVQFPMQNGVIPEASPLYADDSVGEDVLSAENITIYSFCVKENCKEAIVYVRIQNEDSEKNAAFKFADNSGELSISRMQVVASSMGIENHKDIENEDVQAELAIGGIPAEEADAEITDGTQPATGSEAANQEQMDASLAEMPEPVPAEFSEGVESDEIIEEPAATEDAAAESADDAAEESAVDDTQAEQSETGV